MADETITEIWYGVEIKNDPPPWTFRTDKEQAEEVLAAYKLDGEDAVLVTRTVTYTPWKVYEDTPAPQPKKLTCFLCGKEVTARVMHNRLVYPSHATTDKICAMSGLLIEDFKQE